MASFAFHKVACFCFCFRFSVAIYSYVFCCGYSNITQALAQRRSSAMASHPSPKMPNSPEASACSSKLTLQSILTEGRESLATINDERLVLQRDIQRKIQDINQTITDYWVTQAKGLQDFASKNKGNVDGQEEKWRFEFAVQEVLKAKAASARQKQLWTHVDRMVQDAKDHDDKFWASWLNSLHHLATPDTPEDEHMSSTPGAKSVVRRPRRGQRFPRTASAAKSSTPQGPTALTASRDTTRSTKPSAPIRSSESSKPSASVKAGRVVANVKIHTPHVPDPSPLCSPPVSAIPSVLIPKTTQTARKAKHARAVRSIAVKTPTKPAPISKPLSRKRRAHQSAKTCINPHPVIDPKPGQLYQAYYHSSDAKERGWYMGTVLPWTSSDWADEMMMDFSMRNMDLESDWPDCCEPGYKTKTTLVDGRLVETKELTCIQRWMPGFEDGGARVMDRKFLFLFFEDRPKRLGCLHIDPTEPTALIRFELTGAPVPIDWVGAKDLRAWNVPDGQVVRGMNTAEKYRNKLNHVAWLRSQNRIVPSSDSSQQQTAASVGTPGYSPIIDGSSLGGASDMAHQLRAQDGKQQMEAMTPCVDRSPTGVHDKQNQSLKEQGNIYPNVPSPGQMDIDEAYEEPPTYTKRATNKRPLNSDHDEYDEGLGMDFDLNLRNSASQMSRPTASLMGLPPLKLPRLVDYNMPASFVGGSGLRSPDASYANPVLEFST